MSRDRARNILTATGTPRRRIMAAAALAPLLAGTVAGASATTAGAQDHGHAHEPEPEPEPGEMIEPVTTTEADWQDVQEILGRPGDMRRQMLWHTPFLRDDLHVVSQGIRISSALALGTHVSFVRYADGSTMLMGDLVVAEDELQPVTDALRKHGVGQTAIHKHLLTQSPAVWWTHVHAHGHDPLKMARGLRAAIDRTTTPPPTPPGRPDLDLDTEAMDAAMGISGVQDDTVYKYSFIRSETMTEGHLILPPGLGSTTALIFQPTGRGRAVLSGDLAMVGDEVQDALVALRRGGINLVTLHNHGLRDDPRLFFFHVWAVGDPVRIAGTLRRAVATTNVEPIN
ncbi:DUF1259 domain-containing protein [Streptomyces sp. NBC_01803]|uniref:DUF1259 domain-containing protein n=1 Tax=Streptomyces sp. NBC_01803 TaxID=2975946 RepID=UPI002DDB1106|nr:DUF1259 domain-containing protein [Streptomyces sp. NBC_01803]WSA46115.1 DUF1259 domain-containing protein [Streptomyces sp. NBC_01803]